MKQLLVAAALLALSLPLFGQVAEGDQEWAARADGAVGAHASPARIDAAIAAYHTAVTANPNDLQAQWKLLRAYRFKGAYTATSSEEKKKIYGTAKAAGPRPSALKAVISPVRRSPLIAMAPPKPAAAGASW